MTASRAMVDRQPPLPEADETDGLDESAADVPDPNAASAFTGDFALPTVVPRGLRSVAVVSLALAFVLPVVAIPLGHVALRRLRNEGGRGRVLAQAAVVVGYLMCLVLALLVLNVVVAVVLHHG